MARKTSTNSGQIDVYNSPVSLSEPMATISLNKVSGFEFCPRSEANSSKPLYFCVGSSSSSETVTRFYVFPKLDKEKFTVKTQGS